MALVYLTHGPVKELMDRTVLLLMGASPVQQNNASGELSPRHATLVLAVFEVAFLVPG
jgi:hypothetical protein